VHAAIDRHPTLGVDGANLAIGARLDLSSAPGGPGRGAFGLVPAACTTVTSRLSATVPACLSATVASIAGLSTTIAACLCAATVASIAGLSTTVAACLCAATVAGIAGLSTTVAACLCAATIAGIAGLSTTVAGRLTSSAARVAAGSAICTRCATGSTIHSRSASGALAGISARTLCGGMLRGGCVLCRSGMGCRCASAALLLRRSDCGKGENHQQYGPFGQDTLLSVARIHSHSCEMCSLISCIPPTGKRSRRERIVFFRPAATYGFF
jgi:hypothetical protein